MRQLEGCAQGGPQCCWAVLADGLLGRLMGWVYAPLCSALLAAAVLPATACLAAYLKATAAACVSPRSSGELCGALNYGAAWVSQILLPCCAEVHLSGKCLWFVDASCSAGKLWLSYTVCDAVHASPRQASHPVGQSNSPAATQRSLS